jgi:hypothetical protein
MSRADPSGSQERSAALAALPIAAAAALLAARWLPLRFEYRPNELGIVSAATEALYPHQQETFWLLFALAFGTLVVVAAARWLARAGLAPGRALCVEACGAACLASALLLPTPLSVASALAAVAGARAAAGPPGGAAAPEPASGPGPGAPRPARSALGSLALGVALLVLAAALTPGLLVDAWNTAHGVADERLVRDDFTFQGEIGQHLAWADALRRGRFHGRDFFCLYGPLQDLGVAGFWALAGRSIAAYELHHSIARALGLAALLGLAASLLSRRAFALAIPFLVPWVSLRIGLALAGLGLLFAWLRTGSRAFAALAGVLAAASLLYSQEFGLAFALTSALAFALYRDGRAAATCFGVALASASPLLAWYAANGALAPMLRDLVGYPAAMLAGFGKLPFPSLAASLPLGSGGLGAQESLLLRMGYALPAVAWAAILLALRLDRLDPRRLLASAAELVRALRQDSGRATLLLCGVFGLLTFRTALGRSDLVHVVAALPPAALLFALAGDRLYSAWRERRAPGALVVWRAAALALFALAAGLAEAPRPLRALARSASDAAALWRHGSQAVGSREVMRVVRWLQLHSEPDEALLFLPNDAAYYYLLDRPSPIRFVMGHQIATDAHRAEVLDALRREPPRFVVWDHGALRVDDLSDERVFGRDLLGWIEAGYAETARLGDVAILERRSAGAGGP